MYSYCIISNMKQYTQDEISKHNTVNDCWIYSDNNVYNITEFIRYNPEHTKVVLNNSAINSRIGGDIWNRYKIGHTDTRESVFSILKNKLLCIFNP